MLSEHNPIAELIHQIQKKWIDEVSPHPELKLVRWIIKPEEARLYEGFLKLESTEHGAIPEALVAMLTPFKHEDTFSSDLITDWNKAYNEDKKTQEKLSAKGTPGNWNPDFFLSKSAQKNGNDDDDDSFLKMLVSFHKEMIGKSMRLVVAFFPHSIHNMDGFRRWLTTMLKKNIPGEITFMLFDHIGEYYFDSVFKRYPEVTLSLHMNLDMDGAVSKIAKMGNPNSPEVKFRECILEMGQSLQKNNYSRLEQWGEKALQITQRSGLKSLFASAHIVYAGMLFNFKKFDKIDSLLTSGLSIAKQGMKAEGAACMPLVIQFHGFIGSSKQLQKKMTEAINSFEKQGDAAIEYKLPGMALTPYRQAYMLGKKHSSERYAALIQKAYSAGEAMPVEEQLNSSFAGVAYDFLHWNESMQRREEAVQIDNKMTELFGPDWKDKAKNPVASYTADPHKLTVLT